MSLSNKQLRNSPFFDPLLNAIWHNNRDDISPHMYAANAAPLGLLESGGNFSCYYSSYYRYSAPPGLGLSDYLFYLHEGGKGGVTIPSILQEFSTKF